MMLKHNFFYSVRLVEYPILATYAENCKAYYEV